MEAEGRLYGVCVGGAKPPTDVARGLGGGSPPAYTALVCESVYISLSGLVSSQIESLGKQHQQQRHTNHKPTCTLQQQPNNIPSPTPTQPQQHSTSPTTTPQTTTTTPHNDNNHNTHNHTPGIDKRLLHIPPRRLQYTTTCVAATHTQTEVAGHETGGGRGSQLTVVTHNATTPPTHINSVHNTAQCWGRGRPRAPLVGSSAKL